MGIKEGIIRIQVAREIDDYKRSHGGRLRRNDFFNNIHVRILGSFLIREDVRDQLVYKDDSSCSSKLRNMTYRQFMQTCQSTAERIGIMGETLVGADKQLSDAYCDFVSNRTSVEKYNAIEQNLIETIWLPLYMELRMQGFNYADITR